MKKYTNHKYPTNVIVINNLEDVLLLLIELISFGQEPASLIDILLTKKATDKNYERIESTNHFD